MDISEEEVEIRINGFNVGWYKSKGYEIPTKIKQLFYTRKKDGKRYKNGTKRRIATGSTIKVKIKDLTLTSHFMINWICEGCNKAKKTEWRYYRIKKTKKCNLCNASTLKTSGHRGWWIRKLILDNPNAKCDISGERDKRFLIIHHLVNTKDGGKNEQNNYIVLSANYHHAFHQWNGGTTVKCTPELYYEFKQLELIAMSTVAPN